MILQTLLASVSEQAARYDSHLWTYCITGNWAEITVKPDHRSNPASYRMAVIRCGQVFKSMEKQAARKGYSLQIQTFPMLEESHLVAILRVRDSNISRKAADERSPSVADPAKSTEELLKQIAVSCDMSLQRLERLNGMDSRLSDLLPQDDHTHTLNFIMALNSSSDNPFAWLKTGYWLEDLEDLKVDRPELNNTRTNITLSADDRIHVGRSCENGHFTQVLISVQ